MKRETHSKMLAVSEDTTTAVWFAETNLTVNSPIKSPKDVPNVPLLEFFF